MLRGGGKNQVAIVGVGNTEYGVLPNFDAYELGIWALKNALVDAGLSIHDVDGLILNRIPDYQRFSELCGLNPRFTTITPGHGRFSGICIQNAAAILRDGQADVVALVYGNNGRSTGARYGGESDSYGSGGAGLWFPYGMTSPGAFHALMMRRHMHFYGTSESHLGEIAMTFRNHASLNPQAVMQQKFSMNDYLQSRLICDPLRLLDYCLINDGGVAMIMVRAEDARSLRKPPVFLEAYAQKSAFAGSTFPPNDFWFAEMQEVSEKTFSEAGVTQEDVDALMIYDNFTPTVLFSLEGFGYCPQGMSGRFVADGNLRMNDGRFPTNTSGGHISESYMQGWALNIEAVRQLRYECDARQIKNVSRIHYMAASPVISSILYANQ
jgi:acetyl-CoA acetyltransferase